MHDTALSIGSEFIKTYASAERRVILELGSLDVNGSLRDACPEHCVYFGIDVEFGKSVDIKIDPSQSLPLRAGFSDLTISTSQMEHDPCFWNTFLELCRVTRKGGLIYISAPSNGCYHCFPIDVWRFYPDAGRALANWARKNGHEITLLESFTAPRLTDMWNDFVAVFVLGDLNPSDPVDFLADRFGGVNAWKFGCATIQNAKALTEDQELLASGVADRKRQSEDIEALHGALAMLTSEKETLAAKLAASVAEEERLRTELSAAHDRLTNLATENHSRETELAATPG